MSFIIITVFQTLLQLLFDSTSTTTVSSRLFHVKSYINRRHSGKLEWFPEILKREKMRRFLKISKNSSRSEIYQFYTVKSIAQQYMALVGYVTKCWIKNILAHMVMWGTGEYINYFITPRPSIQWPVLPVDWPSICRIKVMLESLVMKQPRGY